MTAPAFDQDYEQPAFLPEFLRDQNPFRAAHSRVVMPRLLDSEERKIGDVRIVRTIPDWARPLRQPARYKGADGGRASGKSHFFAEEAVEAMVEDPTLKFACLREFQRSLKHSAKALIEAKIYKFGVAHLFDILEREIRRKDGPGVMIFEGLQEHTVDSIKSLEGFSRAWVEEAQNISPRSLKLLLPTIRMDGSEIWFSWNKDQPTDPVDEFFEKRKRRSMVHVHVTYRENPFCPADMRTEAEELLRSDVEEYEHVWEGGYDLGGSGRVYSNFKNKQWPEGNVDETLEMPESGELLVGMDFNVNPMNAIIATRAVDECLIHDSITINTSNTEEMAEELELRYPGYSIIVCPDPSGKQRRTSAPVGQTDFTILERHGFEVRAPDAAPLVVDRVNNSQQMLYDAETKRRRTRIHPRAATLITALSNQVYKEGTKQPDKSRGFDHPNDANGYLLWQEFNVLEEPEGSYGSSSRNL